MEELLVFGYIHEIEVLLSDNLLKVIPDEILILCYTFYRSIIKLGIVSRTNDMTKYSVMDTQTQNIAEGILKNVWFIIISSELLLNDIADKFAKDMNLAKYQTDDVIFGKATELDKDSYDMIHYPCILFFEKKTSDQETKILCCKSKKSMPDVKTMLFCNDNNAIYTEYETNLYQLNLSDIKITDKTFEFIQINDGSAFWVNEYESYLNQRYLKLEYISNTNKLFAIQCESNPWDDDPDDDDCYYGEQQKQCGIYDFDKNKWTKAVPFKYKWKDDEFACITAYDTKLNVIYIQSNNGYTAKYDCDNDKWTTLAIENSNAVILHFVSDMGRMWVEGDALKWAMNNGDIKAFELSMIKNDQDRKWITVSDDIINVFSDDSEIYVF